MHFLKCSQCSLKTKTARRFGLRWRQMRRCHTIPGSYRRAGIGTDVTRKLRKGGWSIQGQVDLHGLRQEDARQALVDFIKDAARMGSRCVRMVHGKGLGSPNKTPVLKVKVQSWLIQRQEVLAFVQAPPAHGGAGALVVLLEQS